MPTDTPTVTFEQSSRNALREYVQSMPGGSHVPANWETDTPHLLVISGDRSTGDLAVRFVADGFPGLWMHDSDRTIVVCPTLAADIAVWYSDDLITAIDLGPVNEANRDDLRAEVAPDLNDTAIQERVERWITAAAESITG